MSPSTLRWSSASVNVRIDVTRGPRGSEKHGLGEVVGVGGLFTMTKVPIHVDALVSRVGSDFLVVV